MRIYASKIGGENSKNRNLLFHEAQMPIGHLGNTLIL